MPVSGEWQAPIQPNSGRVVLPRMTAPCLAQPRDSRRIWRNRRGIAGERSRGVTGKPFSHTLSLTVAPRPSARPIGSPFCQRASEALADVSAPLTVDDDEGIDGRLECLDPVELVARDLDRGELAPAIEAEQFGGRDGFDVRHDAQVVEKRRRCHPSRQLGAGMTAKIWQCMMGFSPRTKNERAKQQRHPRVAGQLRHRQPQLQFEAASNGSSGYLTGSASSTSASTTRPGRNRTCGRPSGQKMCRASSCRGHTDVVPVDEQDWTDSPFKLTSATASSTAAARPT